MDAITLFHQGVPVVRQQISKAVFTVGTDPQSDLVLAADGVAERHLEIYRGADGRWRSRTASADADGGSAELDPGTRLVIGPFALELQPADDPLVIASRSNVVESNPTAERTGIVGDSTAMRLVRDEILRAGLLRAPVLITGETGTGKELAARAIHDFSPRCGGPFVVLNCGSLTDSLLEDILFGHVRGAYTGAGVSHRGAFERAHGGTLFLDEIGELPLAQQAALLRVLDDGRVVKLGGEAETAVDFRLVVATNRDLPRAIDSGSFRLDLYHRLAALRITMPTLRDRPEDVPALASLFLEAIAHDVGPRELDPTALELLSAHAWPGNARELRNVLYRAAAMTSRPLLTALDLDLEPPPERIRPQRFRLEQVSDGRIVEVVSEHRGNVSAAARALGVPRSTVRDRLRRIRLDRADGDLARLVG